MSLELIIQILTVGVSKMQAKKVRLQVFRTLLRFMLLLMIVYSFVSVVIHQVNNIPQIEPSEPVGLELVELPPELIGE